ncbi:MAG: aminotransferase class I/II-fold pyridoxal phosphate-dependent enzyme, partial [Streptococcus sp.]|nr:aminotransferase class I/II-fold pyridoxal phosphate-dependent enzyme [Streptococcus sp.]
DIFSQRTDFLALFDCAYQGFADSLEEDAYPVRMFAEKGLQFISAQSASKNCSLYGQRVGCMSVTVSSSDEKDKIENVLSTKIIRRNYSNPPKYGSDLFVTVMKDAELRKNWVEELDYIRKRMIRIREDFVERISRSGNTSQFDFIKNEKGMFSTLGLSAAQDQQLKKDFGLYLPDGGRIAFPCLTDSNMEYVVGSILAVCNLK